MIKRGILAIGLTVIFLNGCGVNSENTAKEIVQDLEEKNYSTAGIVYEESTKGLSKEDKKNVDEVVSKAVIEFLENRYKELESDSSIEPSFYNGLEKIKDIGIKDNSLKNLIVSYEQEIEELDDEVVEVEEVSTQENETVYQEQITLDFEEDIENLDTFLNSNQDTISPVMYTLTSEKTLTNKEILYPFLSSLGETLQFFKDMPDYSQVEQYKGTYEHLLEGAGHLIEAYTFFGDSYELDNKDLFFKGLESYNKAFKEFKLTGSMYAKEKQQ